MNSEMKEEVLKLGAGLQAQILKDLKMRFERLNSSTALLDQEEDGGQYMIAVTASALVVAYRSLKAMKAAFPDVPDIYELLRSMEEAEKEARKLHEH